MAVIMCHNYHLPLGKTREAYVYDPYKVCVSLLYVERLKLSIQA